MRLNKGVSASTFYVILSCSILGILVLAGVIFAQYCQTRDYIRTEAVITGVGKKLNYGYETKAQASVIRMVECSYEAGGERCQASFRALLPFGKKEGKTISVFYSPEDPARIRDPFVAEAAGLGITFLAVFALGMFAAIRKSNS